MKTFITNLLFVTVALFVGGVVLPASVLAKDAVNTTFFGKKAIKGYDTVAYFTVGKPMKGKKEFEYEWMGANWRFITAEHLNLFKVDPERYAPQYGGYCAYAVALGKTVDIDPNAWKIVNGKLYLNYDQDTQKKWMEDITGYIQKADKNWPMVLKEDY